MNSRRTFEPRFTLNSCFTLDSYFTLETRGTINPSRARKTPYTRASLETGQSLRSLETCLTQTLRARLAGHTGFSLRPL